MLRYTLLLLFFSFSLFAKDYPLASNTPKSCREAANLLRHEYRWSSVRKEFGRALLVTLSAIPTSLGSLLAYSDEISDTRIKRQAKRTLRLLGEIDEYFENSSGVDFDDSNLIKHYPLIAQWRANPKKIATKSEFNQLALRLHTLDQNLALCGQQLQYILLPKKKTQQSLHYYLEHCAQEQQTSLHGCIALKTSLWQEESVSKKSV